MSICVNNFKYQQTQSQDSQYKIGNNKVIACYDLSLTCTFLIKTNFVSGEHTNFCDENG